jgi:peptidyl-prolyl cis-trans isomerase C
MIRRIAASLALLGCVAAHAQLREDTPIIEASGLSITKADFEQMLAGDTRLARSRADPVAKLALGHEMGRAFAMEAEARSRKLDQLPEVQLRIRNFTNQVLASQLLLSLRSDYLKDDAALMAAYEQNKQVFQEPRVRQILVRVKGSEVVLRQGKPDLTLDQARAKAQSLLAKLAKGADFAALAKAESDDIGSMRSGGDIGFVVKGSTEAAFEDVAFNLPVGQVSGVIQTKYGLHIIRVEERRAMALKAVKAALANEMAHKEMDRIIRDGYKINAAYFGQ